MPIRVQCSCGRAFTVPDGQAGTKAFCPMCGVQNMVPAAESGNAARIAIIAGGVLVVAGIAYGAYWYFGRKAESSGATGGTGGPNLHSVEDPNARGPGHTGGTTSPNPSHSTPDHPTPDHPTPTGVPADIAQRANELIGQLDSTDEYVSTRAARELAEMGPDILPLVKQAASVGKKKAHLVLRALRWKDSLPASLQTKYGALLVIINSEGDTARAQVIKVWLAAPNAECAPLLSDLVEDESSEVRMAALIAAVVFRAQVTAKGIEQVISDDAPGARMLGVLAAGLLHVNGSEESVRPLLSDASLSVAAITTLGRLQDERSAPEIEKVLRDPDAQLRARAIEALGRIGKFPSGFPIDVLRDPDPSVKEAGIIAAGRAGEPSLVPVIVHFLTDSDPRMRIAATRAMGEHVGREELKSLLALLRDTDPNVRYEAVRAIGRSNVAAAMVSVVVPLLEDRAAADRTSDGAELREFLETLGTSAGAAGRDIPSPPAREVREGALLALEEASGQQFDGTTLDQRVANAKAWWATAPAEYPR